MAGGISLILFGAFLGLMQWIVIRRRIRHAGWWIAISAAAMVSIPALNALPWGTFVLAVWLIPCAVAGIGMLLLLSMGERVEVDRETDKQAKQRNR